MDKLLLFAQRVNSNDKLLLEDHPERTVWRKNSC